MTYRVEISETSGNQDVLGPFDSYEEAHACATCQAKASGYRNTARYSVKTDHGIVYGGGDKANIGAVETLTVRTRPQTALGSSRALATVHIINVEADDQDREHTGLCREMALVGVQ